LALGAVGGAVWEAEGEAVGGADKVDDGAGGGGSAPLQRLEVESALLQIVPSTDLAMWSPLRLSHSAPAAVGAVVNSAVLLEGGGNSTEAEHRVDMDSADEAVVISRGGGGTSRTETRLSLCRQE